MAVHLRSKEGLRSWRGGGATAETASASPLLATTFCSASVGDSWGQVLGTNSRPLMPALATQWGTVRWAGRQFALRTASNLRERYAFADGERELVVLDG